VRRSRGVSDRQYDRAGETLGGRTGCRGAGPRVGARLQLVRDPRGARRRLFVDDRLPGRPRVHSHVEWPSVLERSRVDSGGRGGRHPRGRTPAGHGGRRGRAGRNDARFTPVRRRPRARSIRIAARRWRAGLRRQGQRPAGLRRAGRRYTGHGVVLGWIDAGRRLAGPRYRCVRGRRGFDPSRRDERIGHSRRQIAGQPVVSARSSRAGRRRAVGIEHPGTRFPGPESGLDWAPRRTP
jgi:hypothetical protein